MNINQMKIPMPTTAIVLALLMLMCVSTRVAAQDAGDNPANWCRNGLFPSEKAEFKLATVRPKRESKPTTVHRRKPTQVHFFSDSDDCPRADPKCLMGSYLVSGNQVIVSRRYGAWICSWYQPQRGAETVGWLPYESLVVSEPAASPVLEKWIGRWQFGDQSLNIRRDSKRGFLSVIGDAIWKGSGDNVHVGSVKARALPQGNELIFIEEECRVTLKLVGDFIVASDNSECGGMNVRFNGVYRKGR